MTLSVGTAALKFKIEVKDVAPDLQAFRVSGRAKQYWEGEWICADCGYIYNEYLGVQNNGSTFTASQCTCSRRTNIDIQCHRTI